MHNVLGNCKWNRKLDYYAVSGAQSIGRYKLESPGVCLRSGRKFQEDKGLKGALQGEMSCEEAGVGRVQDRLGAALFGCPRAQKKAHTEESTQCGASRSRGSQWLECNILGEMG